MFAFEQPDFKADPGSIRTICKAFPARWMVLPGMRTLLSISLLTMTMAISQSLSAKALEDSLSLGNDKGPLSRSTISPARGAQYSQRNHSIRHDADKSDLTITHKGEADLLNIKTHLAVKYAQESGQDEDAGQVMKIREFYVDASSDEDAISSRVGRQSFKLSGDDYAVDGVSLDYRLGSNKRLKFLAGYPQNGSASEHIDTDKELYGVSAESGRFSRFWNADFYAFEQRHEGEDEQQYYGSRLSYLKSGHTASLRVNMDPLQHQPQSGQLNYRWHGDKPQNMNVVLDYRRPGKQAAGAKLPALDAFLKTLSEEEMASLERDYDASFRSAVLSWSRPLNARLHLDSEVSYSSLSRTSLLGSSVSESYHLYGIQLKGSHLLRRNDQSSLKLQYAEHETRNRVSLFINNRTPITTFWRADMQLEAYLEEQDSESRIIGLGPLLKLHYRQNKRSSVDLEFGLKHTETQGPFDSNNQSDMFFSLTHSRRL